MHRFEAVSSTQDALFEIGSREGIHGLVVVAREQTAGRGRRGHTWSSPSGGLWVSIGWRLSGPPDPLSGLMLAWTALDVVREFVEDPARLGLKWPNDLVARSELPDRRARKWGGVVTEVRRVGPEQAYVFGLGLDLRVAERGLISVPEATSILTEFGSSPSPETTLSRILPRFERFLTSGSTEALSMNPHRAALLGDLERDMFTLGQRIRFEDPSATNQAVAVGRAVALADDGALIIETPDRSRRSLRAGEIQHLRETDRE